MLALFQKYIYALGLSILCFVSRSAAAETWTMVSEDDVPPFVSLDKGHKVGLMQHRAERPRINQPVVRQLHQRKRIQLFP